MGKTPSAYAGLILSALFFFLSMSAASAERCDPWAAKVVSVQGTVEAQRVPHSSWQPVHLNEILCAGDRLRVRDYSRAAVLLPDMKISGPVGLGGLVSTAFSSARVKLGFMTTNETVIRLDQGTAVTFHAPEEQPTSLLDLLTGTLYSISRVPRGLRIRTPFVNASIRGTEFLVQVEPEQTRVSVFEGVVATANEAGSAVVNSGQMAIAARGRTPVLYTMVRPQGGVQWALYYPPVYPSVIDPRAEVFPAAGPSVDAYRKDDLAGAFVKLEQVPKRLRDTRFYTYRASLLLYVGRVEEARADITEALRLDPQNGSAVALRSIVEVVQNDKDQALRLANEAVALDAGSAAPRIALSYAYQASFELNRALQAAQEAVRLEPQNALAWARLAELWLATGNLDRALEAAEQAAKLHPELSRTQTILGYAYLTQFKARQAQATFERAIALDQADPLPRLGLGLAKIRQGALAEGRQEIEIAAGLDPTNSLIRSYLGKAYYEEKREGLAESQLAMAKELDPRDPTPWFYDAIRKQSVNRPVEALQDLQRSIELNDNRAVYRSQLLLDQDLAARSASLSRIYRDLGFEQLALAEGWKSVALDPADHSAHRLLADLYSDLPRHEIARVNELLQSQLLQPLNLNPIQPQLAESNLGILGAAGPSEPALNEFNPLFTRNRLALQVDGLIGGNNTWGDDVVHAGLWDNLSYSLGQFHYESDGFRENNDQERDSYNAFFQLSLSHKTSLQAEVRATDSESGDLPLRANPQEFSPSLRQTVQTRSVRLGAHHALTPHSDILVNFVSESTEERASTQVDFGLIELDTDTENDSLEVQHIFRSARFRLTSGLGHVQRDLTDIPTINGEEGSPTDTELKHTNIYSYSQFNAGAHVILIAGLSTDFVDSDDILFERDQLNPKLGLLWNPFSGTTLRAAAFQVLSRALVAGRTIGTLEPTQVAGFNQFYNEVQSTKSWNYGIGLDQKFSRTLFGGAEFSGRDIELPFSEFDRETGRLVPKRTDWNERFGRAYLYWAARPHLSVSTEYLYEDFERNPEATGLEEIVNLITHRLCLGANLFNDSGFSVGLRATVVDQEGEVGDPVESVSDHFWVLDAAVGYQLPKRYGRVTVEIRNLLDQQFRFQDTDPANPSITPERFVFMRFTLAF
jgi:tetratricopeptide (TPR) repeat protein